MSLVINHNMMAMTAARNLAGTYGQLAKSSQRLSSGLRINSAADDAAGLAVREIMRSDITVLNQGIRNANDGISMIQTADGALSVIDERLIRMKELAEQAATGLYTTSQKDLMNSEFQQMASEIDRIANATDFNGIKLLDGSQSSGGISIHFGTGASSSEDYYAVEIGSAHAAALGVDTSSISISATANARTALQAIDSAISSKDTIRANLGALQNRLESTISNLTIQAENLQAAESQISDVDVATEMTKFTKNQILAQAGVAMLSQANILPQMALTLLGV